MPTPHYRNALPSGSRTNGAAASPEVVAVRKLSVTIRHMRHSSFLAAAVLAILVSALVGGFFGSARARRQDEVPQHYARSPRRSTRSSASTSTRCVRPAGLRRDRGMLHTLDPHSSFFDPQAYAQMRERQEGRYYGLGITIQVDRRRHHRAVVFEGSPAYKKGIRRGDIIAKIGGAGREGLDERAGGARSCGAEGHERQHRDQAPRLRRADRHGRHARRGQHPDRAARAS